jgi:hypothetical protein
MRRRAATSSMVRRRVTVLSNNDRSARGHQSRFPRGRLRGRHPTGTQPLSALLPDTPRPCPSRCVSRARRSTCGTVGRTSSDGGSSSNACTGARPREQGRSPLPPRGLGGWGVRSIHVLRRRSSVRVRSAYVLASVTALILAFVPHRAVATVPGTALAKTRAIAVAVHAVEFDVSHSPSPFAAAGVCELGQRS